MKKNREEWKLIDRQEGTYVDRRFWSGKPYGQGRFIAYVFRHSVTGEIDIKRLWIPEDTMELK